MKREKAIGDLKVDQLYGNIRLALGQYLDAFYSRPDADPDAARNQLFDLVNYWVDVMRPDESNGSDNDR